ncbi:bifunctional diguanylate cyclase/phosphodiesterase [Sphingomonas sp. S6]|jgi:diguanylate cyclase (GGDEF)-like protein|uniref:putative bifunctional diguanylate cyclase/phosphodiesterase n=1 Tax=Sphingomonas sp. S6 TaxID=3368600 RepID=UPI000FA0AFD7|nr:EAL domain-containing protein [uncultured Sphingomonas sp.]RTL21807.1 MAG: EAL domain-containing protein [Sphingomonadaceae bacterium]
MTKDYVRGQSVEQASFEALSRVCTAMFIALCADTAAVAAVHSMVAPWWAWAVFPVLYLVPKGLFWYALLYRRRNAIPSTDECKRTMRLVSIELPLGMSLLVAWQVWIAQWATSDMRLLLALCMGGQMVFVLFGLQHVRVASVLAAISCVVGVLLIASGAGTHIWGVVTLLTGGVAGLAYVANHNFNDFVRLVRSRLTLEIKTAEIEALSEQNFRIANTDMLTEIGNRRSCFHDLDKALAVARDSGQPLTLGIIDLDGFKSVNDSHGHVVGDRLLRGMAERLQQALAGIADVYRLGGDEFALIIANEQDETRLLGIGESIIAEVGKSIRIGELRLQVGCSIGFAAFPRMADSGDDLYARADYALFHAKRTGRMKPVVFSEEHERDVREAALLERTLRAADLEAELYLQFQPIVDSSRDTTLLLECLARWDSPVLGSVSPSKFIQVAEQCGYISALTPVLLDKALRAITQWPDEVGISFNLSGHDIVAADKVTRLIEILERSGVPSHRVEFEVTETALMMNLDEALANIHRLKATGTRISLDDFGTGYSSLSQIQKLPLDKIKVDGSFVRDLADSEASQKIVRSVSALSRDLSLSCVVEGVETQEQLDILQDMGCSLIQGYFFAKPLREADVGAFLADQARARGLRLVPKQNAA